MLSHTYMLCDQSQCTVHSFGAYPSVCDVASDLPNLVGSHNETEDFLFSYTSSQRPLAIWCPHSTTTHFPARCLGQPTLARNQTQHQQGGRKRMHSGRWREIWIGKGYLDEFFWFYLSFQLPSCHSMQAPLHIIMFLPLLYFKPNV